MTTSVITGASLDPDITVGQALEKIAPDITRELAYYGVTYAGEAMGIDPRISNIAGIMIRSSLQAGLGTFGSGGGSPGAWLDGALQGAVDGISKIGINYLFDELDLPPIVEQMGAQLLGGIANSLVPGISSTIFHVVNSFTGHALAVPDKPYKYDPKYWSTDGQTFNENAYVNDMANWSWQNTGYQQMSEDLTQAIRDRNMQEAIDLYGGSLFDGEMLDAIDTHGLTAGTYLQNQINSQNYTFVEYTDGVQLAKVDINDNTGSNFGSAYFAYDDQTGLWNDLYGYEYGDFMAMGDLFVSPYNDLRYFNGKIIETVDGYIIEQMFTNGMQDYIQFKDLYGEVVLGITPAIEGGSIYMLSDGSLIDGSITYADGNFRFSNGELVYTETDGVQFDFLTGDVNLTGLEGQDIDIETQGWDVMDKVMTSYDELTSILGTSVAYADSNRLESEDVPQGEYAIRFYAARPDDFSYGSDGKINTSAQIDPYGHTMVGFWDPNGTVIKSDLAQEIITGGVVIKDAGSAEIEANAIWDSLLANDYIDQTGVLTDTFRNMSTSIEFSIGEDFAGRRDEIFTNLKGIENGREIMIGLYPHQLDLMHGDLTELVRTHQSQIRNDGSFNHHYHESTCWYGISVDEFKDQLAGLYDPTYQRDNYYTLGANNCTDLALNVAEELGIWLPYADRPFSNPQDFADALLEYEITEVLGYSNFKILEEIYLPDGHRSVRIEDSSGDIIEISLLNTRSRL
ncbi:MAG: hypothetical protein PHH49_06490 [Candidatus Omnitrophica bacterium]|nr:hypothetical protein [Candidatus Omnitrophota bacterium]